jgi:tetratricopeptide (TPR) repeat protein
VEEQRFFDRLAVFVGGFTLEAAELICLPADDAKGNPDAAELLARLVDRSLVVADSFDLPEYRYRLLETLREYGLERLAVRDDVAVRDDHAAYYLSLALQAAAGLRTGEQRAWLLRLSAEHGNLRAALEHSISTGDQLTAATLAGSLYQFWDLHGHYSEGRRWLGQVRGYVDAVPASTRARVLIGIATLAVIQGDFEQAVEACEEAREVSRASEDAAGLAHALQYLGLIATYMAELDRARELLTESLDTAIAGGAAWEEGWALFFLGLVALAESDFAEADRLAERAEQVLKRVGDQEALSWVLCIRGVAAWKRDDLTAAAEFCVAGLRSFHELGGLWGTSVGLIFCGLLLAGRPTSGGVAVCVIAAAEELRESAGIGMMWFTGEWLSDILETLTEHLGFEVFQREWEKGRRMETASAVDMAVAELGHG